MTTEKEEAQGAVVPTIPEDSPEVAAVRKMGDDFVGGLKLGAKVPKKFESQAVAQAEAGKIVNIRDYRKTLVEFGKELKRRIDAAVAESTDKMDEAVVDRMEPLAKWAWLVLRGEKTKSRDLGGVKIGFRKGQGKLDVTDESAALAYCKDNAIPFKTKESVDKKALKSFLKGNPEEIKALDGTVEYTTSGERFYVD